MTYKTRQYILTRGSYDDYRIIATLEGPATPALSTLYKQFKEEFGIPDYPTSKTIVDDGWLKLYHTYLRTKAQAEKRLGGYVDEKFIEWLKEYHSFVDVNITKFHITEG